MYRAKQAGLNQVITIEGATPVKARGILRRSHDTNPENDSGSAASG